MKSRMWEIHKYGSVRGVTFLECRPLLDSVIENLIKAKKKHVVVRLQFKSGKFLKCKVSKLLGTEIEVITSKFERRKILVNSLVSVKFIDEPLSELA